MSDRFIPEHRRQYKAKGQFKPDELRRRREEQQVEIRKQKREENLAKRRNLAITSPTPHSGLTGVDSDDENAATESQVSICLTPFVAFCFSVFVLLPTPPSLHYDRKCWPFVGGGGFGTQKILIRRGI